MVLMTIVCLCVGRAEQLPAFDVTIKSDADDVIRERHLSGAVAVGLVAAITGYNYKPKVALSAITQA
jgi:hypothetical protein